MTRRVLRLGETQRFLLLSILIGVGAGLVVVCFHLAIESANSVALETGAVVRFVAPALGALAGTLLVRRVFTSARGSGVTDTKGAVYISDGEVPLGVVPGKFLACSASIGAGNPLGPEDPALHMGAGIASWFGRLFRLDRERMRLVAPVGAAAGLAAAFNTPITAVLFVIEEVVAGWSAGVLGSIILASVSAAAVARWFLGSQSLFQVPEFELTHPSELLVYSVVGLLGGLLAAGFTRMTMRVRGWMAARQPSPYLLPVAMGLLVGVVGVWLPEALGAGYEVIDGALHDSYAWQFLLALAMVKAALTLACFSARTPGGMFAPTLFTGAMIGGGIGALAHLYWPATTSSAGAYVLVGMGTFFAGVFRAPMTSIFMIFEVSASYVVILPVMIANTLAYFVSRSLQPKPFFTLLAHEEGLDLPSLEAQRETARLRVEDAVTLQAEPPPTSDSEPHVHPDMPLEAALPLLARHPRVRVVTRVMPYRVLGVLTLQDVQRAYGYQDNGNDGLSDSAT